MLTPIWNSAHLAKPLGEPGIGFADWIRLVIECRRTAGVTDLHPVETGLRESAHYGVTTIGDIAQADWPGDSLQQHAADGTAFFELIAPLPHQVPSALEYAESTVGCVKRADDASTFWQIGLSPHAPYSVHVNLLEKIIELSVRRQIPLAMHLAESRKVSNGWKNTQGL